MNIKTVLPLALVAACGFPSNSKSSVQDGSSGRSESAQSITCHDRAGHIQTDLQINCDVSRRCSVTFSQMNTYDINGGFSLQGEMECLISEGEHIAASCESENREGIAVLHLEKHLITRFNGRHAETVPQFNIVAYDAGHVRREAVLYDFRHFCTRN